MRWAGIIKNDIAAGDGMNVTFFVQGCPIQCEGCHNSHIWDFNGGKEFTDETMNMIIDVIGKNGIQRNFSLMGGEPLCEENLALSYKIVSTVRTIYPVIKIYLWTGYYLKDLVKRKNPLVYQIISLCDYLIDGPYIQEKRDITLDKRGSTNQTVIPLDSLKKIWYNIDIK